MRRVVLLGVPASALQVVHRGYLDRQAAAWVPASGQVVVWGSDRAVVPASVRVQALGRAVVRGLDRVVVLALGQAVVLVRALGRAVVRALGRAVVRALGRAVVLGGVQALGRAVVRAWVQALGRALGQAVVLVWVQSLDQVLVPVLDQAEVLVGVVVLGRSPYHKQGQEHSQPAVWLQGPSENIVRGEQTSSGSLPLTTSCGCLCTDGREKEGMVADL
jgi:hypothetical protein